MNEQNEDPLTYRGCRLSHIEYVTAFNDTDYDQGWSMVFEEHDSQGRLIRILKCSIEPDARERHKRWLDKRKKS